MYASFEHLELSSLLAQDLDKYTIRTHVETPIHLPVYRSWQYYLVESRLARLLSQTSTIYDLITIKE